MGNKMHYKIIRTFRGAKEHRNENWRKTLNSIQETEYYLIIFFPLRDNRQPCTQKIGDE